MAQALTQGIYSSSDLKVMREVYAKVISEPWFSPGSASRMGMARYLMRMYRRGLVFPDQLECLCRIAARKKFALHTGLEGYRFLLVEDDYFTARDADDRSLGAAVIQVPSLAEALDLAEHEADIDGALLDVNLAGETVYPVAAILKMRHIPFAFVTGYEDRVLPPSYRNARVFTKPTDWAVAARHVAGRSPLSLPHDR